MYLTQFLYKAQREYPNDEAVVFADRRQTWGSSGPTSDSRRCGSGYIFGLDGGVIA